MLRLMERDKALIAKCGICRWLSTSQIQRLYFPRATLNAVQKRLRKLSDEGFLRSYRENLLSEAIHAVGPKGKAIVSDRGVEALGAAEVPRQFEHLKGLNEMRIAVEMGGIEVSYFFACWQLANLGWNHPVIPDAIFAVRVPERRSFAAEYDRLTEGFEVLGKKLASYSAGIPGFSFEAVVIVTERDRRLDLLAREVRKRSVACRVLAGTVEALQATNFFDFRFRELPHGGEHKILELPDARNAGMDDSE